MTDANATTHTGPAMTTPTQELIERLRTIDGYLNSLWDHAAKLRDQHTGQAHADLNALRHGIGAIPDGLLDAASRITEVQDEVVRLREALAETHLDLAVYTDIEVARKRLVERRAALEQKP